VVAQDLIRQLGACTLVAVLALGLAGCPGAVRWDDAPGKGRTARTAPVRVPHTHTVKVGESLYAIALRYDLSGPDLARWNRLGSGDLIFPGQVLRLRPNVTASAAPRKPSKPVPKPAPVAPPRFVWPAQGPVVSTFNDPENVGKGIDIKGKKGDAVHASGGGRVVYSGDGLIGYGNLIIVKHDERYLSAYGYNDSLLVKEGDQVHSGQTIARMGLGPERQALLHFEIRELGKPVDPQRLLPGR
jgi:lipoprotein NlpD